jgi:hypothetical protein
MTLDQLALKYKTDKSSIGHNYAVRYDTILYPYRELFTNVLEIGVHEGGSHKMWEEYFPNAIIHGMDIKPECKACESERIKIAIADQGNKDQLLEMGKLGPFDLIVDDGSHLYEHQILTFKVLFPFLKQGGIFIVEDVLTSYWFNWGYALIPTCVDYFKGLIDEVNLWGYCPIWTPSATPPANLMGIESIQFMRKFIVIHKSSTSMSKPPATQ